MAQMSFLDPQGELPVDEELWIVALLRKPKGSNPEHAFIMVEGCNSGGQAYFIRYDLTIDEDNPNSYEIHLLEPQNVSLASSDASVYIPALINNLSEHKNKFVVLKYVQFTEYV
jgi:hypothetical protein